MKPIQISILFFVLILISCSKEEKIKMKTSFVEFTTDVTVTAYSISKSDEERVKGLFESSQNIMEYFNNEMSPELENSTLSVLNKEAAEKTVEIPKSLKKIIKISHNLYKYTDKSFNVTLSPVVKLWGFYTRSEMKLPNPIKLIELMKISNFEAVLYRNDSIYFSDKRCGLDLGGIGKGYAVDSLASFLKENDVNDFIVEAGGDLIVNSETPRSIGIRHPRIQNSLIDTLYVKYGAIATSGDYEKFFIEDSTRYCHSQRRCTS